MASDTKDQDWSDSQVKAMRTFAELLTSAMDRKQTHDAVRESEALNEAMLSSLPGYIVVLDKLGLVLEAGDREMAGELPGGLQPDLPGTCYAENWNLAGSGEQAEELLRSISQVTLGLAEKLIVEYRYSGTGGDHWLEIRIQRLRREGGGALLAHLDITDRKRSELYASRSLRNLAHFDRVAAMGELAASLAHELKQPLAAISMTADALRLLLDAPGTTREELEEAVADIQDDNHRAGEILSKLRAMVTKETPPPCPISVNQLVSEVLKYVANDALLRRVKLLVRLEPELPLISADRVQLQQVLLNLIINGMDAMRSLPEDQRILILSTQGDGNTVAIQVRDHGTGIPSSAMRSIFEPFFTTKEGGTGIGLSISRSIIQSYRGSLTASNAEDGGALFRVTFPVTTPKNAAVIAGTA